MSPPPGISDVGGLPPAGWYPIFGRVSVTRMGRLPPALAANATPQILELLGEAPGRVLDYGFAGIHAAPLRLAGFDVVVVEPDPDFLARAAERAGGALTAVPAETFDSVVAPADA